jgi:hypothetical protein
VHNVQAIRAALFALCLVPFTTTAVFADNTVTVTNTTPELFSVVISTGEGSKAKAALQSGQTVHLPNAQRHLYLKLTAIMENHGKERLCEVELPPGSSSWKILPASPRSGEACKLAHR